METETSSSTRRDAATFLTEKICEHLKNGTVPWRMVWADGGVPANIVSKRPFKGLNVLLTTAMGYATNLFVTAKQLEGMDGSIRPRERPHHLMYYSRPEEESGDDFKPGKLAYYPVYNIAQCVGIKDDLIPVKLPLEDFIKRCEDIVANLANGPAIRHKDTDICYDPLEDYITIPKPKGFSSPASYYSALFHQLAHATGHHTRLDRMGLVQMAEYGCGVHRLEELVAEITTNYLENIAGIPCPFVPEQEYLDGWIRIFSKDRYFILNACSLAQKAIDFILNVPFIDKDAAEE